MSKALNMDGILQNIKQVLPTGRAYTALHEPLFSGNEWMYVKDCLDSGWVSSVGSYVDRFEHALSAYTGIKYAVAVVNGTAALHLGLLLAGVQAEDEVLVPGLTFVATANAVRYCGAVPHFVDSETLTLGLDPRKLQEYLHAIADLQAEGCFNRQSGRRIRAVIPMHTFGHAVDMDPLAEIAREFNLTIIEDAAESLGSFYKQKHTGTWGQVSVFSFNGNKIVTTGGGGALLSNDEKLYQMAKHLSTQAKLPDKWFFNHDRTGFNYRLPNLNAALGCAQLEQLDGFIARKRALAQRYQEVLADVEGLQVYTEASFACSNYWLNTLLLDEEYTDQRDRFLEASHRAGIMSRPAWTLMHQLPMYQNCPRMDLSTAESLERRIINIPSSAALG